MKLKRLLKWTTRGLLVVLLALTGWGVIAYWTSTNECDKKVGALVHPTKAVRYCEYGVVTFDDVEQPEALRLFDQGHARGKVVIKIE